MMNIGQLVPIVTSQTPLVLGVRWICLICWNAYIFIKHGIIIDTIMRYIQQGIVKLEF